MPTASPGNEVQARMIAEQVADAAITKFVMEHPEFVRQPETPIPPPLKWAAGVLFAIMSMGGTGMIAWTVTTLSELQITVARIDERQQQDTTHSRLDKIEERLSRLEEKGMGQ